jgi:hypothetical protein
MRLFFTAILVSVTAVAICGYPVNGSKGLSNDTDDVNVPKVTYCELIKHPKRFHDKVVEVTAIFERGFEKSYLFDEEGCNKGLRQFETWVGHDESFVIEGD